MISERMNQVIRNVPDFPKEGILFKDITPLFSDPQLCRDITREMADFARPLNIEAVAAVEARGFLFGFLLAQELNLPFVPIRKAGKLPYHKISREYDLEYGTARIEMHTDAIRPGQRVLLHDDLLATGGSAEAAAELIRETGGVLAGFTFLVDLRFLGGYNRLLRFACPIESLVVYE